MFEGILCAKSHEYIVEDNGVYVVGLTEYAVEQLGDVVFVELPEVGSEFAKGEVFSTVESVKAASEIYMPVGAKIVEVNDALIDSPEILNESPLENGWLVKVECENFASDSTDLLEYDDYKEEVK
ncbi:glycine cleavage system protein GcvH [bacterium]|nr:glycine cleavage system protein GcvH [bacterium]